MNRKIFKGLLSIMVMATFLQNSAAAFTNPYTLSDLINVASIFMEDPMLGGDLTCAEAID